MLLLAGMIAAYSSSAYSSVVRAAMAGVAIVGGAALMGEDASDWAFIAIVLGGAWLVGFVVMQRSTELSRAREDSRDLSVPSPVRPINSPRHSAGCLPGPAPEEFAALTAREIDVARAIATGMSNAEIASHLCISNWTVKTHVASILRILGLRDRAQVVVAAYEAGLVEPRASVD